MSAQIAQTTDEKIAILQQELDMMIGTIALRIARLHNAGNAEGARLERAQFLNSNGQAMTDKLDAFVVDFIVTGQA